MENRKTHLVHAKLPVPPVIMRVLFLNNDTFRSPLFNYFSYLVKSFYNK